MSFGITTALALGVYLLTLAPDVTLGFPGIFSAGAMYAGVPHPPGYPLWTIYAWLFAKLLPWSNIAWRLAVSSAFAAALACGVIALMVSRGGAFFLEGLAERRRLTPREAGLARGVSGYAAGMTFGFSSGCWERAVVVDTWPLSLLLIVIVLCLLMRWFHNVEQKRYLYAAGLVYGLALTNSQLLFAAAPGLQCLVALGNPKTGRDIFLVNGVLFVVGLLANRVGYLPVLDSDEHGINLLRVLFVMAGAGSIAAYIGLALKTGRLFSEWKTVQTLSAMILLGLSLYFYVPLASMTNPPVNWGYPRTVQGFMHVLTRGQYERIHPTPSLGRLAEQLQMYGELAVSGFGLFPILVAVIPFGFLNRLERRARRWMFGLVAVYACLVLLMLVTVNPTDTRQSGDVHEVLFAASHAVLAVWTGYGLIVIGSLGGRSRSGRGNAT